MGVLALALALAVSACSSDKAATSADHAAAPSEKFAADETAAAVAGLVAGAVSADADAQSTVNSTVNSAAAGRMIIRTAELAVQVADVAKAAAGVQSLVAANGGFVASQQGNYAGVPFLTLVLRVPATTFDSTITGLRGLGRLTNLSTASNEVTAQVVDLDSRLRTKRASADRLRTLLGSAAKASDLIEIERELSDREAEIESMQGQRNVLADQVSLSTVTVALSATQPSDVQLPAKAKPSFMNGLRGGGRAMAALGRTAAQAGGALLPFLPVLLAVGVALRAIRRRRARRVPTSTLPPPPLPNPPSVPEPPSSVG